MSARQERRASASPSPPGRLRVFLGAFGDAGHAFPMLALGKELAARGHRVAFETWSRWRREIEAEAMEFVAAPEYPVFPTRERPLRPYEAVVRAAGETRRALSGFRPDVLVHDVLTLAPAMAAELEGVPHATLVPHVYPVGARGFPPYALGARLPRTALGRRGWSALEPIVRLGLERGRAELNEARRRLGLGPVERLHGGLSPELTVVATFPQLEYPRDWPAGTHVVGPLMWQPPSEDVETPSGEEPLVLIAPSTAQDPEQRLLVSALRGLARARVRVLATTNRKPLPRPVPLGPNSRLYEWISYSRTMPGAALAVCHGGHGTLARALSCATPVLVAPHSGDMSENAARAEWAGVGIRLPWRLVSASTLRLAVERALGDPSLARRAAELARWYAAHNPAGRAAALVEELAWRGGAASASEADASARS